MSENGHRLVRIINSILFLENIPSIHIGIIQTLSIFRHAFGAKSYIKHARNGLRSSEYLCLSTFPLQNLRFIFS